MVKMAKEHLKKGHIMATLAALVHVVDSLKNDAECNNEEVEALSKEFHDLYAHVHHTKKT